MSGDSETCPNGHTTKNQIGNCYTCGEPFGKISEKIEDTEPPPVPVLNDDGLRRAPQKRY